MADPIAGDASRSSSTPPADSGPVVLDVPIGIDATGTRTEHDSLGSIEVPADRYWGAQTERSLLHFRIGHDIMPTAIYRAYGYVKKAAAIVNADLGGLPRWKAELISRVCDEIIAGDLDREFPLHVFQTGSGTQSNMNVNEVIANRAIQLVGGVLGSQQPIHPNDDVNKSQSSNDSFPTAMHIATVMAVRERLLPSLVALRAATAAKAEAWKDVVKIGRTHLQDATPMTVGQEFSGYVAQIDDALVDIDSALPGLYRVALGGTAVGTGLNAPRGFDVAVAATIAELTGLPFVTAPNKFAAQASLDAMARMSSRLRDTAVALYKYGNDMRWLGSGPRSGLGELRFPDNEPGSSIMPGKVNPTQAEALMMACVQIIGLDTAVAMCCAEGNFELNTFRPVVASNVVHMITLLTDSTSHFRRFMIEGAQLNHDRIARHVDRSVMLVTALSPLIGYDRAAEIAHLAMREDLSLREAALRSGHVTADDFDRVVDPLDMTNP